MKTPKTIIWVQIVSPENNLSFLGLGFDYDGEQDWTGKGKLEFEKHLITNQPCAIQESIL